ncbi:MAG: hypothetical protein IJN42_01755 [Clostridia bacterium]|nr:hypothetical protein [Clostridia bacterium]
MAFRSIRPFAPSATGRSSFQISEFKGLDRLSGKDKFSPARAEEMQNFIRDKVGRVKKRGGFQAEGGTVPKWQERFGEIEFEFSDGEVWMRKGTHEFGLTAVLTNQTLPDAQVKEIYSAIGYSMSDSFCLLAETDGGIGVAKYSESDPMRYVVYTDPEVDGLVIIGAKDIQWEKDVMGETSVDETDLRTDAFIPVSTVVENATPSGSGQIMFSPNILTPYVRETFTVTKEDYDHPATDSERCARFQLSNKNVSLLDGNKVISSDEWMAQGEYWAQSNYGELTETGVSVLKNSIKVEVYRRVYSQENAEDFTWDVGYAWVNVTDLCFGTPEEDCHGFFNTEKGALWIPDVKIRESPEEGHPNVRITYLRDTEEQLKSLRKLLKGALHTGYGVGGYKDRVFIAAENRIYYTEADDGLWINELNYVEPCPAERSIVAMGGQGKYLYAVDSEGISYAIGGAVPEDNTAAFARDASFVILDHVQGEKPVGNILDVFGDEFCYLSEMGLVAIRHDDFYDKRYAQNRSRMLGDLLKGKQLCACRWENFMVIGAEDRLYLLDEVQQTTLPDCKYSGKQYEVFAFVFDQDFLGASTAATIGEDEYETEDGNSAVSPQYIRKIWTEEDKLKVAVGDKIWTYDPKLQADQDENGKRYAIVAHWVTPKLSLSSFYRKKTIHRLALTLGEKMSSVRVECRTNNREQWKLLRDYDGRFYVFDYGAVNYGLWTYRSAVEKLQLIINRRPSISFNEIQFKFTNANEDTLSLEEFGMIYETEVL